MSGRVSVGGAGRSARVHLHERSYDVVVGTGLLETLGQRLAALLPVRPGAGRCAAVIADAGVPATLVESTRASLASVGFTARVTALTTSEEVKSIETAARLLGELAGARHERGDPVVAIGGGVLTDLAGFVAATYRRGVPIVQCPTTLLGMVDAAVGGKTAVNLRVGGALKKNMVGVFHQPIEVVCDVAALASLARVEVECGLAECVKHGLLGAEWGQGDLLAWTERNIGRVLALEPAVVSELVWRNASVKAAVVSADEREEHEGGGGAVGGGSGAGAGRMGLNMGHTVGHAIETIEGITGWGSGGSAGGGGGVSGGRLKHGQAVGLGLVAEAACGEAIGVTAPGTAERVRGLLEAIGLPTRVGGAHGSGGWPGVARILELMKDDKKTAGGGRMRLALPTGDGRCRLVVDPPASAVGTGLGAIVQG